MTALPADGQLVVAGAADKRICLFERSGMMVAEHQARGDVFAVTASADGEAVAAGDGGGYLYWLNREGRLLWEERRADKVWAAVLSPDGQRLLVGAGTKEAHLCTYDQAGQLLWRRYVGGSISSLALSADGQRVAAGTRTGGSTFLARKGWSCTNITSTSLCVTWLSRPRVNRLWPVLKTVTGMVSIYHD